MADGRTGHDGGEGLIVPQWEWTTKLEIRGPVCRAAVQAYVAALGEHLAHSALRPELLDPQDGRLVRADRVTLRWIHDDPRSQDDPAEDGEPVTSEPDPARMRLVSAYLATLRHLGLNECSAGRLIQRLRTAAPVSICSS